MSYSTQLSKQLMIRIRREVSVRSLNSKETSIQIMHGARLTDVQKAADWAEEIKYLVDVMYPGC